eukprot:CAMPEP_0175897082 /NCGR_PEP_ID=MMETSP0108-20121206/520_1 /TAXON_ID=195067 ORGANISM="Goniomonas pacifica, Strain CCMP1869" /NCGR_SAMPLE_ID=MMETSP0108 /ASSEMBLY_ACC=CAM_ASM_000204 /LENGTH=74 /DNA_ID=CAMNT_0017218337 /DNA_START=453 /DNA_END=677 /DNA_ORIENTATION=-
MISTAESNNVSTLSAVSFENLLKVRKLRGRQQTRHRQARTSTSYWHLNGLQCLSCGDNGALVDESAALNRKGFG